MVYIANRMTARPNRVQTAVETLFLLMRDNIAGGNMDPKMARKWFPFVGTLFLFIWFSNLIGYIPLPTNDAHPVTSSASRSRRSRCTPRRRTSRCRSR
jgi:F-type H+-transporting ATPase subunit a